MAVRRSALYIGGFLGPFGGGVVTAMLPEMGRDLDVSTSTAAMSLTAYLLPFAALMLVSGTLGAHFGRARTIRLAYIVYVVSSVVCSVTPWFSVLLAARVVQGAANAFTTPLLLAALAAVTPKARLGRALGTFGALQAAGQTSAPLVGGLAAEVDWRIAFGVIALVAALLTVYGVPADGGRSGTAPRLRDAMRLDVLRTGVVAMLGWGALGGLSFLVAFRAGDDFGLGPTARGLLLTGFGVAGIVAARPVGALIDRIGAYRTIITGALLGAALVAVTGTAGWLVAVGVAWAFAGAAGQLILVGVNSAILGSAGANRAGAVSVVQAFRFGGAALAPAVLTPLYGVHPIASFLVPAGILAVAAPALLPKVRARVSS